MHAAIYARICKRLAPAPPIFDVTSQQQLLLPSPNDTQRQATCLVWRSKTNRVRICGHAPRDIRRILFEHYYGCELDRQEVVAQLCDSQRTCCQPAHLLVHFRNDWRVRTFTFGHKTNLIDDFDFNQNQYQIQTTAFANDDDICDPPQTPASELGSYGMVGSDVEDMECDSFLPCIDSSD